MYFELTNTPVYISVISNCQTLHIYNTIYIPYALYSYYYTVRGTASSGYKQILRYRYG